MIAELDLVAQLHRESCPTLILVGEHDQSSPPAVAGQLRDDIDGATMHVVLHAAHLSPLERTEVVDGFMLPFLTMVG